MKNRLLFLDQFRGILLLFMIIYHYLFNLEYFLGYSISLHTFPLSAIPPVVSALFLLVSGFSVQLSSRPVKRGLVVLVWAGIITLITYIATPDAPITFGILHCIGTMMIISVFLKNMPSWFLAGLSICIYILGQIVSGMTTMNPFLFMFGITTPFYRALDFYPLFPHGAWFMLGIFISRLVPVSLLSGKGVSLQKKIGRLIHFLGKNSLAVYLIHQPIFFAVYFLFISVF